MNQRDIKIITIKMEDIKVIGKINYCCQTFLVFKAWKV